MDPLKSAPLPPQDTTGPATPKSTVNEQLLDSASSVDDLAFLSLFDSYDSTTITNEQEHQSTALADQVVKQGITLHAEEVKNESIGITEEKSAKIQNTQAVSDAMQAENAAESAVLLRTVDGQLEATSVTSLAHPDLEARSATEELAFLHNNNLYVPADFAASKGYSPGQEITYKDEKGAERKVTVQILSANDMNLLAGLVRSHIDTLASQSSERAEAKDEEKLKPHPGKLETKHTIVVLGTSRKRKHESDDKVENGNRVMTSIRSPLKDMERSKTEAARDQEHEAKEIDRLKEKHFKIITTENNKYDISHQNHLSEILKSEHDINHIPRHQLKSNAS